MDAVADFLTRIRNAGLAKHEKVDVPSSGIRAGVAKVLKDNGYIQDFRVVKDSKQGVMRVYLKYGGNGKSTIQDLKRMSRPGRRYYVAADSIPEVRSGFGIAILSTSKGIVSGNQAKSENLGGELLCTVW